MTTAYKLPLVIKDELEKIMWFFKAGDNKYAEILLDRVEQEIGIEKDKSYLEGLEFGREEMAEVANLTNEME